MACSAAAHTPPPSGDGRGGGVLNRAAWPIVITAESGRSARRLLVVLLVVFAATLPAVTPRIYASDEIEYFAYLRSAWFDRDLSFDNEYRWFHDSGVATSALFRETFLERTTPTGLRENFGTIGCALLWAPFYLVADLVARSGVGGPAWTADGYSPPYVAAVAYGSAVYGFLALVAGWWAAIALVGHGRLAPAHQSATEAAVAVWLGTPLLFYMYIAPPMSHACSAFAVAVFVLTWLCVRRRWSVAGCAGLGALAALMTMVREQDAFVAIGPAIDWAWTVVATARTTKSGERVTAGGAPGIGVLIRGAVAAAAAFAVAFLPQAMAYLAINGHLGPSHLVGRKMAWHAPHAWSVVASTEHGLFAWTPLAALAVVGLAVLAWRRTGPPWEAGGDATNAGDSRAETRTGLVVEGPDRRRATLCLLAMVASQVYVAGSVQSWTVAGAFGQRRFVGLSALFVIGIAALVAATATRTRRMALAVACVLGVWWNIGLMVQFGTGLMDRQRLNLGRNAVVSFVELPVQLPALAYRYVFDRASFYRAPVGSTPQPQAVPR